MVASNTPAPQPASSIPATLDARRWDALEPLFRELLDRPVRTGAEFERWLLDRSELEAACSEAQADLYITMTCSTEDQDAQAAYATHMRTIVPKIKPLTFELDRRMVRLADELKARSPRLEVLLRDARADVELFREENVPLETELSDLSQKYEQVMGAMTVTFDGREQTLSQMAVYQERTDRAVREAAWRGVVERRLADKAAIDAIFDQMVERRHRLAINAGFSNFVGFSFKAKHRFDYTPADCFAFHDACEKLIVPIIRRQELKRRQTLKLDTLRPWDLSVDVRGRAPLKPFTDGRELMDKSVRAFEALDPRLGAMLRSLGRGDEARGSRDGSNLDLDSRKGKAPGGYQYMRDRSKRPFIFMNAASTSKDVTVMLHEAGHAFHSILCNDEPLLAYRHAPIEFCEVASMSMELLTLPHVSGPGGFYPTPEDYARAARAQIERSIFLLPWVATIDAFQHWIYTNPTHTQDERRRFWIALDERFGSSCSWQGLEEARASTWHRQPHLFSVPFYYIEYAIAQLGALQLWLHSLEHGPTSAIDLYIKSLSLGGSRPLPELFHAAGLRFDFSAETVQRLADRVERELDRLPE